MNSSISQSGSPQRLGRRSPVPTIVRAAVMVALVFVVTKIVFVPISAVPGQIFNAGDIVIFIAAWTFGPAIGGLAGGVGSSLSDALTGGVYAPFTLIIKGSEGVLAGYFALKGSRRAQVTSWLLAGLAMVGGYFITNAFFIGLIFGADSPFNPGLALAIVEVPFDIAQVLAGGIIGGPISRYLKSALPSGFFPERPTQAGPVRK